MNATDFDARMAKISRFAHGYTTGTVLELGIGVRVYSKTRVDSDGNPIGGIVVEMFAGSSGVDQYGEIFEQPAVYRTYDPQRDWGHAFSRIDEPDVDMSTASAPPSSSLVMAVRAFAREVGKTKQARGTRKHGASLMTSWEMDLVRYAEALRKVVAGGGVAGVAVERATLRKETDDSDEF